MSTTDNGEEKLRDRLDGVFGSLTPTPIPTEAIIGAGRRIRRRRVRLATSTTAVVLLAALGGAFAFLPRPAPNTPPVQPPVRHSVSVNPTSYDRSIKVADGVTIIGSGTVDGHKWSMGATLSNGKYLYLPQLDGESMPVSPEAEAVPTDYSHGPLGALEAVGEPSFGDDGEHFYTDEGFVPDDVDHLVFAYADGETAVVPATVLDGHHFVAFVGPEGLDVTRITAYDAKGAELGYSIPWNPPIVFGEPQFASWYSAGQTPRLVSGTAQLSGTAAPAETKWSFQFFVGPFGICAILNGNGNGCAPPDMSPPGGDVDWLFTLQSSSLVEYAGILNPAAARATAVLSDGSTVSLPITVAGGVRLFGICFSPHIRITSMNVYDEHGRLLPEQPI